MFYNSTGKFYNTHPDSFGISPKSLPLDRWVVPFVPSYPQLKPTFSLYSSLLSHPQINLPTAVNLTTKDGFFFYLANQSHFHQFEYIFL